MYLLRLSSCTATFFLGQICFGQVAGQAEWRFSDHTASSGVQFTVRSGSPEKKLLLETMTGGLCVLDYDGDGWPDLFFVNGTTFEHWNSGSGPSDGLFRNKREGTFEEVTRQVGLLDSAWGMGCVAADFDNDGDSDLFVANAGPNFLYVNDGKGVFTERAKEAGLDDPRWSTGAAFGDYDQDGYLDLYLANYVDWEAEPQGGSRFCSYRGADVACGPRGLPGQPDVLFRNNGDGTFSDVSEETGIAEAEPLYGFQPIWSDFDLDGDLDIFVTNDSTPNFLWINGGDGRFAESALLNGVAYNENGQPQANMGVDVADYNGDGYLDIYSTNFSDDYNVLYSNSDGFFWEDVTPRTEIGRVTLSFLGFGALFADLNNDSWPDLFNANGHIYPQVDEFKLGTEYHQRNQLFLNSSGSFKEIGQTLGPGLAIEKSSRGTATLDWDRDGDLDLVVSNIDGTVDLLRNDLPNSKNYLTIRLRGRQSNRDGVGARITLGLGNRRSMQELRAGSSYLSSSELALHFGMGTWSEADFLEVLWPSAVKQRFEKLSAGQRFLIDEQEGIVLLQ